MLERLRHGHEDQLRLFEALRIITRQQREKPGSTAIASEQLERQIYRMSFSAQSMLSDVLTLERRKQTEITAYRRKVDGIVLGLAGLMTVRDRGACLPDRAKHHHPPAAPAPDTEIIGSGNLDHRVGTAANDELGDLSRDFDRMLNRLHQVTASREELAA